MNIQTKIHTHTHTHIHTRKISLEENQIVNSGYVRV